MLVTGVPHLNSDTEALVGRFTSGHFHDSDVNWEMAEILFDLSSWTFDDNLSGFGGDGNYSFQIGKSMGVLYLPPSGILTKSSLRITFMFQKNAYIFFY